MPAKMDSTISAPANPRVPWNANKPRAVVAAIQAAADACHVTPRMILGGSHEREVVAARKQAIHALREFGLSTPLIGKMMGGIHHTSVLHHMKSKPKTAPVMDFTYPVPDLSGEWAI